MPESDYVILTLDGGGMRGVISALLVQQLHQEFHFLQRVHLFAGTSTGGLIALGLASEVHISELVDIYLTKGDEVFTEYVPLTPGTRPEVANSDAQAELEALGLFHVRYTDEGLKNVIENTFPSAHRRLDQLGRKVLVTAFDLYEDQRKAWAPVSLTNLPGSSTGDIRVLDAALSTAAGPVYFPPHVFDHRGRTKAFIDGGVYANNPSMLAAATVMASGALKERGLAFQNIKLLSLGTGFPLNSIPPQNLQEVYSYGVVKWMWPRTHSPTPQYPLLEILMDGVSSINTFQCEQILGNNFRRGNVELPGAINPDDVNILGLLVDLTEAYMRSEKWQRIKDWIASWIV